MEKTVRVKRKKDGSLNKREKAILRAIEKSVDKKGYVTKAEIICAFKSDLNNAVKMIIDMLYTGSFMSGNQIEYLIRNIKNKNGYYSSDVTINNQTRIVFLHYEGSLAVCVLGTSPYD